MVRDEESNRLEEAFEQMEAVLYTPAWGGACPSMYPPCAHPAAPCIQVLCKLLEMATSHEDAAALKGFACLRELRRAAVQEEEPRTFNACLRKLKVQYLGTAAKAAFWAAIATDPLLQPGLVTAEETEESGVTAAEAATFLATGMDATKDGDMAAPADVQDEDDEYGGLD